MAGKTLNSPLDQDSLEAICSGTACGNVGCQASQPELQICSGCSCVAYCGELCQQEEASAHRLVCSKMKRSTWRQRLKLVSEMIRLAEKLMKSSPVNNENLVTPTRPLQDTDEGDTGTEDDTQPPPTPPASASTPKHTRHGLSWDMSISPVRDAPESTLTHCLVRFSSLSTTTWTREVDVIMVKVWQDLELTGIGAFYPLREMEQIIFKFKMFSTDGQLLHEQEDEELYPTDLARVGEMKLVEPVKLEAHRRYYLVVMTGGVTCWSGKEGTYLHCIQTERGGVQVAFETPKRDILEEFLENTENFTNTDVGQIPALFLRGVKK